MNELMLDDDMPKPALSPTAEKTLYGIAIFLGLISFFSFGIYVLNQEQKGNYIFFDSYQAFIRILFSIIGLSLLISKYLHWKYKKGDPKADAAFKASYFATFLDIILTFMIHSTYSLIFVTLFIAGSKN